MGDRNAPRLEFEYRFVTGNPTSEQRKKVFAPKVRSGCMTCKYVGPCAIQSSDLPHCSPLIGYLPGDEESNATNVNHAASDAVEVAFPALGTNLIEPGFLSRLR